ncbi:helix-turn-helix domain-containing protein [Sporosarcina sp. FSL K6-3457]|uniref:helix-turn-helix domain-containing protein n=1 Tax=Sporosarcina sp. FSL K6-3457 TaxID=2978204 RepID=UPI0030FBFA66
MQLAYDGQPFTSTEAFIHELEQKYNYGGIEFFFAKEKKLLQHLFLLEGEEAHQVVQEIIESMQEHIEEDKFTMIKYYLITLSSIMARNLESDYDNSSKAFTFNVSCFMLIDSKLNDRNAIEVADEIIEFYMHVLMKKKRPALLHNTVNNVILHIDKRIESALTVEEIAKQFNISASHLSRIFREHTGSTLVEYINIRKVEESQYHLRFSDKKIAEISDKFFFCNQSYFTRIFKKYTGRTPREFRSSLAGEYYKFTLPGEKSSQWTVNRCNQVTM